MPIHTSWKKMALGMKATYTKKGQATVCRKFTDGSQVCMSKKGWSVFFATINKMSADETKPRPKKVQESNERLIEWFTEAALQENIDGDPQWVLIAEKLVASPATTPAVKGYWRGKLADYREENKENMEKNKERMMAVKSILGIIDEEAKKMET